MFLSGWNLEPSKGGSPSKRYWQKVKAVAEAMRNCWYLQPTEEAQSSPVDGPLGFPPPHDFLDIGPRPVKMIRCLRCALVEALVILQSVWV